MNRFTPPKKWIQNNFILVQVAEQNPNFYLIISKTLLKYKAYNLCFLSFKKIAKKRLIEINYIENKNGSQISTHDNCYGSEFYVTK